ncbi:MAG TPA: AAC(3) family N-acetyltransferase [Anaerolineales bacterium]|nr:AAC(3) family N-acetyltransferase [Anaerolineales bacterium]
MEREVALILEKVSYVVGLDLPHLRASLLELELTNHPVIAHASLKAFGHIQGGADTMVRALIESTGAVIMPTFTYKTQVTPAVGPPNNGITYGSGTDSNRMAEPFHLNMPADPMMGMLPEALRLHSDARRTSHPILSFAGIHADEILATQTLYNPLAPIGALAEQDGWVVLLGVNHSVNTSIHFAEKLAGRKQFIRWALTKDRVVECPGFPGDSSGFDAIRPFLASETRRVQIGNAWVQAVPLKVLFEVAVARIKKNPLALLCERMDCERCQAVRASV